MNHEKTWLQYIRIDCIFSRNSLSVHFEVPKTTHSVFVTASIILYMELDIHRAEPTGIGYRHTCMGLDGHEDYRHALD